MYYSSCNIVSDPDHRLCQTKRPPSFEDDLDLSNEPITNGATNLPRTELRTSHERSVQPTANRERTEQQTYHERSYEPITNLPANSLRTKGKMPCNAFYCLTNLSNCTTNLSQRMENAPDFDLEPPFRNLSEAPLPIWIVPSGSQSAFYLHIFASGKPKFHPEKG